MPQGAKISPYFPTWPQPASRYGGPCSHTIITKHLPLLLAILSHLGKLICLPPTQVIKANLTQVIKANLTHAKIFTRHKQLLLGHVQHLRFSSPVSNFQSGVLLIFSLSSDICISHSLIFPFHDDRSFIYYILSCCCSKRNLSLQNFS